MLLNHLYCWGNFMELVWVWIYETIAAATYHIAYTSSSNKITQYLWKWLKRLHSNPSYCKVRMHLCMLCVHLQSLPKPWNSLKVKPMCKSNATPGHVWNMCNTCENGFASDFLIRRTLFAHVKGRHTTCTCLSNGVHVSSTCEISYDFTLDSML